MSRFPIPACAIDMFCGQDPRPEIVEQGLQPLVAAYRNGYEEDKRNNPEVNELFWLLLSHARVGRHSWRAILDRTFKTAVRLDAAIRENTLVPVKVRETLLAADWQCPISGVATTLEQTAYLAEAYNRICLGLRWVQAPLAVNELFWQIATRLWPVPSLGRMDQEQMDEYARGCFRLAYLMAAKESGTADPVIEIGAQP